MERAEAKEAIAAALRLAPKITIHGWPMFAPYRNAGAAHMIDALREAGFP